MGVKCRKYGAILSATLSATFPPLLLPDPLSRNFCLKVAQLTHESCTQSNRRRTSRHQTLEGTGGSFKQKLGCTLAPMIFRTIPESHTIPAQDSTNTSFGKEIQSSFGRDLKRFEEIWGDLKNGNQISSSWKGIDESSIGADKCSGTLHSMYY